ncbi:MULTISPECIES: hypothetical protein [Streptomyces]|uniref:Uncharacterized protein n=1 Tax=Streptomyces luteosporeus TaxID=173856 RepID=A0ABP6G1C5_9ACTN
MTQEAVPDEAVPAQAGSPRQAAPKGLLQQMEELMAALNADLTQLDADLQSADRSRAAGPEAGPGAAPEASGDGGTDAGTGTG